MAKPPLDSFFTKPPETRPPLDSFFTPTPVSTGEMRESQPRETVGQAIKGGIKQGLSNAGQATLGGLKSIPASIDEVSKLGQRVLRKITSFIPGMVNVPEASLPEKIVKPSNNLQTAGFIGGQIAQIFATGKPSQKVVTQAGNLAKLANLEQYGKIGQFMQSVLNLGAKSATEGAIGYGTTKVQGGNDEQAGVAGGIAATLPVAGKVFSKLFTIKLPSRLVNSIIKPAEKAFHFGKNPGLGVAQEGITANTIEGYAKNITTGKKQVGSQIEKVLSAPEVSSKILDTTPVLSNIDKAMKKAVEAGDNELYQRLSSVRDGITKTFKVENGRLIAEGERNLSAMNPKEVQKLKTRIGEETRWTGQAYDDDLNKVRVKIYRQLDKMVDETVSGVEKLNSRYANLLTAETAIQKRMHVLQRQDLIGLKDLGIGLGVGTASSAYSSYKGDSTPEAILKGIMAGLLYKTAGSTAVKSRAASTLVNSGSKVLPAVVAGNVLGPRITQQKERK